MIFDQIKKQYLGIEARRIRCQCLKRDPVTVLWIHQDKRTVNERDGIIEPIRLSFYFNVQKTKLAESFTF